MLGALLEGLAVIGRAIWPQFLKLFALLGIGKGLTILLGWLEHFLGMFVVQQVIAGLTTAALLVAWGVFLGVFWTFVSGTSLRDIFSLNPLAGVPGGMLYLASSCFPLKFAFGTAFAYIVWRFTLIQAAIVLNRLVKLMYGV